MKEYFAFRISYKNASNNNFGAKTISNIIRISKPIKPVIDSVKMTDYNKFTITLLKNDDKEDIIGNTKNISNIDISNTEMGVFLKDISFNVKYQYGDGPINIIPNYSGWEIQGGNDSTILATDISVDISTESFSNSTYSYILPAGLFENSGSTESITYFFEACVKNNLIDEYSVLSDASEITITKPDSSIDITFSPQTSGTNYNNKIEASWNGPSNGNRGIVSAQANAGLPKLVRYTLESNTLRNVNSDTTVNHTNSLNTSTNRNSDPSTTKMFTFYDTLKGTSGTTTKI